MEECEISELIGDRCWLVDTHVDAVCCLATTGLKTKQSNGRNLVEDGVDLFTLHVFGDGPCAAKLAASQPPPLA